MEPLELFFAVLVSLLALYLLSSGIYFIVTFFALVFTSVIFWVIVAIVIFIWVILIVYM